LERHLGTLLVVERQLHVASSCKSATMHATSDEEAMVNVVDEGAAL
jgi:hypothetical protein